MNSKLYTHLRNFGYSFFSNLFTLISSILVTLIVPKLVGVQIYSYWQLFIFYSAYVGFFHFGWSDGVYLKYGGNKFEDLDKNLFYSQIINFTLFQFFISIIIFLFSYIVISNDYQRYIFYIISVYSFFFNIRGLLLLILQSTYKIKEYTQIVIIDRLFYIFCITIAVIFFNRNYVILILSDLFAKLISVIYEIYIFKKFLILKDRKYYFDYKEIINNIKIGISLMFANIASMLIIGVVRFGIEKSWDIITFGKISLILSISNIFMVFINAISIVMFPLLRRLERKRLPNIYIFLRKLFMLLSLSILLIYYPIYVFANYWLPQYSDKLLYLSFLFPICIFEGKNSFLVSSLIKTYRLEKIMMYSNIFCLILSIVSTYFFAYKQRNFTLTIINLVIMIILKSLVLELFLCKHIKINIIKEIITELTVISTFMLSSWFFTFKKSLLIYLLTYILYLFYQKKSIFTLITIRKNKGYIFN